MAPDMTYLLHVTYFLSKIVLSSVGLLLAASQTGLEITYLLKKGQQTQSINSYSTVFTLQCGAYWSHFQNLFHERYFTAFV